jgi:hypothetical protein
VQVDERVGAQSLGGQCLTSSFNNRLQGFRRILAWVQTLAMPGNALFVYEGEAEAAFARGLDVAIQRSEGGSQGVNGCLNLVLCGHILLDVSCKVWCKAVKVLISLFWCACHKKHKRENCLEHSGKP